MSLYMSYQTAMMEKFSQSTQGMDVDVGVKPSSDSTDENVALQQYKTILTFYGLEYEGVSLCVCVVFYGHAWGYTSLDQKGRTEQKGCEWLYRIYGESPKQEAWNSAQPWYKELPDNHIQIIHNVTAKNKELEDGD